MEPTVTAVIVAYWPSRYEDVQTLVNNLHVEAPQLDDIIVINNNHRHTLELEGATVINSSRNFTSRSKYAAALLAPSDYYLLLDDDVLSIPGVLDNFLKYAEPGCCFSTFGLKLRNNFFHDGEQVRDVLLAADPNAKPEPVDAFIGIVQFLSHGAIVKMLDAEEKCRLPLGPAWRNVGEDILVAMANKPVAAICPRAESDECRIWVRTEQGEAMQHDEGYHSFRDRFAFRAWQSLGYPPFPGYTPEDEFNAAKSVAYLKILKDRDEA